MARDFNGSTQYLNPGNDTNINAAHNITPFGWIYPDNLTGSHQIINRGKTGGTGSSAGWGFGTFGDELEFVKNAVVAIRSTTLTLTTSSWQFVAAVETSSGVTFYHITPTGTITSQFVANTSGFDVTTEAESSLAANYDFTGAPANYFDGGLAYVGVKKTAMTQAELLTVMRSHITDVINGLWELQGNNNPEDDWSSVNFTASLVNTPTKFAGNPPVEHLSNYISGYC